MPGVKAASGVERVLAAVRAGGGWGYRSGGSFSSESTAMCCLALSARGAGRDAVRAGLAALAKVQRSDGGVPISEDMTGPCWPTALAVLAWRAVEMDGGGVSPWSESIERGIEWLLGHAGIAVDNDPPLMGHDTSLIGWSWAEGTHSWVEPTAFAVMALRRCGMGHHPRVVEGVRLLRDRAIPGGGWNYGNTVVMGHRLRPFPMTTGIALAGLCGTNRDAVIDEGIAYLQGRAGRIHSRLSAAWARIGLGAWGVKAAAEGFGARGAGDGGNGGGGRVRIPTVLPEAAALIAEATVNPLTGACQS